MEELNIIQTKLKAPKKRNNDFGKYTYRKAEDILEAVKPLLAETKCTITITDDLKVFGSPQITERNVREYDSKTRQYVEYKETVDLGSRYFIMATATITNSKGEEISANGWAELEAQKKGMDAAQLTGSTSSYARKYALNALLAIDDNKDPDEADPVSAASQRKTASVDPNLMAKAVAEVSAAQSIEAVNAVWQKYYAVNIHLCDAGTPFYDAVSVSNARLKTTKK